MLHDVIRKRVYVRGILVGEVTFDEFEAIRNRVLSDKAVIARQIANYLGAMFFTTFDFLTYTSAIWCWTVGIIAFGQNDWSEWIVNSKEVIHQIRTTFVWSLMLGVSLILGRMCLFGVKGYVNVFEQEISEVVKKLIGCSSADKALITN
ncbi:MAG: hypothetical protein ACTS9Y_00960 [Methylophilus sp.]|uniref:hypothetical protein n=1 Tax=Methylophilus sp. TaxID=29541 RepID=UPI003F9EE7BA